MNAIVDEIPEIATALAKWYADHSSIRRLWATADAIALRILVAIEPTFDGDDTLPIWLANKHWWTSDLRLRLKRELQLQLVVSGSSGELDADTDAVTIVDVSWRDSWMAP